MKKLNTIIILLALITLSNDAISYETMLVKAELESFNSQTKQVVFNGKTYKFKVDVSKTEYSDENVADKMVKNRDLKIGQIYYFSMFGNGDNESEDFDTVVFISTSEPEV